jgi:23S rRNA (adenine2503-C2)-methyltransferase
MGLIRHLSPQEIVGQWFAATHAVGVRPSNLVFMGMGEPMDNIENVITAIGVLKDHNGPSLPISKITVSTVGRVDGIRRLGEQLHQPGWHRLNLAVSLNAPNDEVRSQIMPINRKWNMAALQEALLSFPIYGGGKLCIEYVLIPGVNDRHEHAKEIAEFLAPLNEHYLGLTGRGSVRCMVNLIPYNPRRNSPWEAPTWESVDQFMFWLTDLGVYTKRRRTKGRDLMGACGQLGSEEIRGRRLVPISVEGR